MRQYISSNQTYDKSVKIDKREYECYSPSKFSKIRSQERVLVIGETKSNNNKSVLDTVRMPGGAVLVISKPDTFGGSRYKTVGYFAVGDDSFVEVKQTNVLFVVLLAAIVLMLLLLIGELAVRYLGALPWKQTEAESTEEGSISVPTIDPSAETLPGQEDPTKATAEDGGGSVSLTFSNRAYLTLETNLIKMNFQNPAQSTHDIAVYLYLIGDTEDVLIGSSGRLVPGYGISEMQYDPGNVKISLSEGQSYKAYFLIECYDSETGTLQRVMPKIDDVTLSVN